MSYSIQSGDFQLHYKSYIYCILVVVISPKQHFTWACIYIDVYVRLRLLFSIFFQLTSKTPLRKYKLSPACTRFTISFEYITNNILNIIGTKIQYFPTLCSWIKLDPADFKFNDAHTSEVIISIYFFV